MRTIATTVFAGVLICSALGAQVGPAEVANPTFDVVSVKPNKSSDSGNRWGRHPVGGWFMFNMTAGFLIRQAYPTKVDDFVGAPAWAMFDRFDVDARATFVPTVEQERLMLRALLADRFKLAARGPVDVVVIDHIERPTREVKVFAQVSSRPPHHCGRLHTES